MNYLRISLTKTIRDQTNTPEAAVGLGYFEIALPIKAAMGGERWILGRRQQGVEMTLRGAVNTAINRT